MSFPAVTPEYTEVSRAVQLMEMRLKKLVLQEMKKSLLYSLLVRSGNVLQINGASFEIPFYVSPPAMGQWINKNDSLGDAASQAVAMGYATNRYVAVPMGWNMLEQWEIETSPQKMFDRMDLATMEQSWALRRTLSTAAWTATGGKEPDGISSFIEAAAPSAQTAVHLGVNKATKAWFRNSAVQLTKNFGHVASGSNICAGILALIDLIDQATNGTRKPSHLITRRNVFNMVRRAFMESSTPYHMIGDRGQAQVGFENFMVDGVWMGWDPDCTADKVYALHIDNRFDPNVTNGAPDNTVLDNDLEDVGKSSIFEMNGPLSIIYHPNIRRRRVSPRSPLRQLNATEWMIDSFNLCSTQMEHAVGYSDNGSRWSTW